MRAVLLEVPESMLNERRRLGLDGRDEIWDGILHMVPPPGVRISTWPESCTWCSGRWVELLRAVGGRLLPVSADAEGAVRSEVLGAQFATADGRLRITWEDGVSEL